MNKYDLLNKNGAPLCHAFGCRKHTKLIVCYNGLFCKKHKEDLDKIRENKGKVLPLDKEIDWRLDEIRMRKIIDPGHMYYLNYLGNKNKLNRLI